jgi:hypothetical protein
VFPSDYRAERRALFGGPKPHRVVERPEQIQDLYKEHVGESFRFRLPIRVGELVYKYEFDIAVSKVEPYLKRAIF